MDALRAEIANKRKTVDEPSERATKYMRRGDLDKLKEEKERERRAQEEQQRQAQFEKTKKPDIPSPPILSSTPEPSTSSALEDAETFNVTNPETIRRLRSKGQPIRLFGETDKERRLRLRALELIEGTEKGEKSHTHNDFRRALEGVERGEDREEDRSLLNKGEERKAKKVNEDDGTGEVLDLGLIKTDPDKLYPIIYYALKRTLKEWGQAMDERPEQVKRTTQGKLAAATQVQSAEYLKPLFKALRSRSLPADVLARMAEIVHHMQNRQYQRANDSYLRLSIGNAPWPIGVTMVGIHERSAREKISSDQVAHVLNDEVSRKYIQSLKRLLTFSQTKYPPADISQLMG